MQINWFPGHMAKTRKLISENLKLVDIVYELVDARIPESSKNPEIEKITRNKPKLTLLNKCDLADDKATQIWLSHYEKMGRCALLINSITGYNLNKIPKITKELLKEKIERDRQRGIVNRPIKIMVVGIPNVGKSSFINKFTGGKSAQTGDRPGVTKGKQWIRLKEGFELLDTPGILWPKFEDKEAALRLAYTGAIKDEILDVVELSFHLLEYLNKEYKEELCARYKIETTDSAKGVEILELICKKRGFILPGAEIDYDRGAKIVLDEFRACKIGKITLGLPKG